MVKDHAGSHHHHGQKMRQHSHKSHGEHASEAHQLFRAHPGNTRKGMPLSTAGHGDGDHGAEDGQGPQVDQETVTGILSPGATGVIYCTDRAVANGFSYGNKEWANFGQGAPETGMFEGAQERPRSADLSDHMLSEYGPGTGVKEIRQKVAALYNDLYRQGKSSQYTFENVCIVPGGRAGLIRISSILGDVNVGFQLPEYTAYEQMLSIFKRFVPIPSTLEESEDYRLNPEDLHRQIRSSGLQVIVASNPRNPTGQVVTDDDLAELVHLTHRRTTLILDEFYSWYIYDREPGRPVSAAEHIEDVNKDSVILLDGLTKGFRLPGWRICWVIGPKSVISALNQSGSFLDGGANHPLQTAALPMLEPKWVRAEIKALQSHFQKKRDHVLARLEKIGLKVRLPPKATFYIWLDLKTLPAPIDSGLVFFEELLKEKVIVVPGIFFDINPAHRRDLFESPCHHFVRLSFGPPLEELDRGLDGIERLVDKLRKLSHAQGQSSPEDLKKGLDKAFHDGDKGAKLERHLSHGIGNYVPHPQNGHSTPASNAEAPGASGS